MLVAGKARHIGVSNYTIALLAQARALSPAPLVTNQVEYHPYLDQHRLLAAMREADVALTAYYAMADGKVLADPVLSEIAASYGRSIAQIVLRWLIQQPGVVALTKTISEDRARSNFKIFDFELDAMEMAAIGALANPDGRKLDPDGLSPDWDK